MRRYRYARIAFAAVILLMFGAVPALAKGPWRVTVHGPGIEGEIDLLAAGVFPDVFWLPGDFLGQPIADPPLVEGEPFVVTWYAVMGAGPGEKPQPLVDRVAFYPAPTAKSGYAEVLEISGGFFNGAGWYSVRPDAAAALDKSLRRLRSGGLVGVDGYRFDFEGTGPDAEAAWVVEPLDTLERGAEGYDTGPPQVPGSRCSPGPRS